MASTGRLLRTYAKKWGNSGKSNTADSYSNRSGDQLYLSNGSSRAYYDVPASQIDFTTSVSGGVYLLSCDPQVYITNPGGGDGVIRAGWHQQHSCTGCVEPSGGIGARHRIDGAEGG